MEMFKIFEKEKHDNGWRGKMMTPKTTFLFT